MASLKKATIPRLEQRGPELDVSVSVGAGIVSTMVEVVTTGVDVGPTPVVIFKVKKIHQLKSNPKAPSRTK